MGNFDDTNEGSIYYDDNQGGCGEEAQLTVLEEGGRDVLDLNCFVRRPMLRVLVMDV